MLKTYTFRSGTMGGVSQADNMGPAKLILIAYLSSFVQDTIILVSLGIRIRAYFLSWQQCLSESVSLSWSGQRYFYGPITSNDLFKMIFIPWHGSLDLMGIILILMPWNAPNYRFTHWATVPWINGKEVPRWGVAEIQKMSPSTTGRCYCLSLTLPLLVSWDLSWPITKKELY